MRERVKIAVEQARSTGAVVEVDRLAAELAEQFHDSDGGVELMIARLIIAECARTGLAMEFRADHAADGLHQLREPIVAPSVVPQLRAICGERSTT